MHVVSDSAVIVAIRPAPGSSTSISPISAPGPSVSVRPGRSTRTDPATSSINVSETSPCSISDVAGHETLLVAPREELVEQPAGKPREQLGLAHHPLVAAAVEEQRLSLAVARVLDVPEEERVVATPVRAHDTGDEMRQRALDERRLAHHGELRLDPLRPTPGEEVGQPGLTLGEHADAEPVALVEHAAHAAAAVERDQHERRAQRDGHEGVRGHPVHLVADARRQHGDARREHAERPPERDRRVAVEVADVDQLRVRDVVEGGVAEPLERPGREPAGKLDLELTGRRRVGAHASIVPTGGALRSQDPAGRDEARC